MGLKVVQWATGGVGVAAIKGVLEHPDLELVGCWVYSPGKAGKDVGEIIGIDPLGITATNSIDEILALDADAVIYSPLMANPDEVAALLRSGKNVVTPVGWLYPSERSAAPMREAALEGNATLHGTGMAPGGISEKFPLLFSAFSTGVTFVRAEEFSDLRTYEAPDVLRHVMGFGEIPDKALTGPMQKMLDSGFIQAVKHVRRQDGLQGRSEGARDPGGRGGVRADRLPAGRHRARPGRRPQVPLGGARRRRSRRTLTVNWLMGEENLDPAWTFGPAGQRYEMEVRGNPDITIVVKGFHSEIGGEGAGTRRRRHGSALRELGARGLCGGAGYRDVPRLPLISGKAAPRLS